jgi:hypothetical protein
MNCSDRSEHAKRLSEELNLILQWSFLYRNSMNTSDQECQNVRKEQVVREILDLRQCCSALESEAPSRETCHLAQFFGACPRAAYRLRAVN